MLIVCSGVILAMSLLSVVMIQTNALHNKISIIEDSLTSSALAGLETDLKFAAVTGYQTVDADKSYDNICRLMGENLGLSKTGQCSYRAGEHSVVEGDSYLSKVLIFALNERGEMMCHEYLGTENGTCTPSVYPGNVSAQGEHIEDTSVYIEYVFNIKFCGEVHPTKKGSLTKLWLT